MNNQFTHMNSHWNMIIYGHWNVSHQKAILYHKVTHTHYLILLRNKSVTLRFRIVVNATLQPAHFSTHSNKLSYRKYAHNIFLTELLPIYTVCPQKSEPLNILQQKPQICSDLNKILHTQDDIRYKHYYIVSVSYTHLTLPTILRV